MSEQVKTLEQLQADLAAALKDKEALTGAVEDLNKRLADLESNPNAKRERPVVTINKAKYKVMIPKVEIPGHGIVSVQDIKDGVQIEIDGKKSPVGDYLVSIGSGMLKLVK
jgi:hypothetical protein